jgi:mannose-6-phosphate isomerase-like protein (cupin superfamily)
MTIIFGDLVDDADWVPMSLEGQQDSPKYFWNDGGMLADAPVDFAATFGENMFVTTKPIEVARFNRNPLRVVPNFTVPRHHHNIDEMLFVFAGEYLIEHYDDEVPKTVRVRPGEVFLSRAGTAYEMTAGPEGVTYIETWPVPVTRLETYWHDSGWVGR